MAREWGKVEKVSIRFVAEKKETLVLDRLFGKGPMTADSNSPS